MFKYSACAVLTLAASIASAHHGTAGQFDQSRQLQVSGVITRIRFVNPHSYVYFDVTADDGTVENWRCEMRAGTVLRRSGWSADMFAPGTMIHIDGVPARREPHGCYVNEVKVGEGPAIQRYEQLETAEAGNHREEGRPATLPNGQPNISGDWAAQQRLPSRAETLRRASGRSPRPSRYTASEAGLAAAADFVRDRDNPRFHCQAVNLVDDWNFDQHINRIEQTDDTITMTYGFMDIVRTIHLDRSEHPGGIAPSRAGHSIGNWDGNTLTVDTLGFSAGWLDVRAGVKHSEQLHVAEKFVLDLDRQTITRSYTIEDSLFLAESRSGQDVVYLSPTPFEAYDCEDLTEEIVEGF